MIGKRMFVREGTEAEDTCYIFEIETQRGRRRVYPPGIGKLDEAACASSEVLDVWMRKLGVTRVVSAFDCADTSPECIADGTYSRAAYIRWWKRVEGDCS